MQKRANSARAGQPQRKRAAILIGLSLAGSTAGGLTVGTGFECHGEATTKFETSDARNGPKGTAAEYRAAVRRVRCTNRTLGHLSSALLKRVYRQRNIEAAWKTIQQNARTSTSEATKREIEEFAEESGDKLRSLCHRLSRGRFEFGKAKGIPIPKRDEHGRRTGKYRPIVLASVETRIVQRALLEVLMEIPALGPYVQTPYSFGGLRKKKADRSRARKENISAVPGAIKAALDEIKGGARFVACADIKSFFTRISKKTVTDIVSNAVRDAEFLEFFQAAIEVELSNMAELRERIIDFPTEDIGVAQGSSLSPLLGNMILADFDRQMNEGDCRCIRYVDDFLILAPSAKAGNARLRKAIGLLQALGMELSPEKSSKGAQSVDEGILFLGIEIKPGIIRPNLKSQTKFLASIEKELSKSQKAFEELRKGKPLKKALTIASTFKRVDGMLSGWGKHYWFCNDDQTFERLDSKVQEMVRGFLKACPDIHSRLGMEFEALARMDRSPFAYPKAPQIRMLGTENSHLMVRGL